MKSETLITALVTAGTLFLTKIMLYLNCILTYKPLVRDE